MLSQHTSAYFRVQVVTVSRDGKLANVNFSKSRVITLVTLVKNQTEDESRMRDAEGFAPCIRSWHKPGAATTQ